MIDLPTDPTLPALPFDAPDDLLADAIRRDRGIVARVQRQAAGSYAALRDLIGFFPAVHAIWTFFDARRQATEPVGRLRVALQTDAALRAFAGLPQMHKEALGFGCTLTVQDTPRAPYSARSVRAEARAAMASHPVLAWFQAQVDDEAEARAAERSKVGVGPLHSPYALSPAALLRDLRRRTVGLALDDKGRITVPPGTVLSAAEWAVMTKHRAALAKLLAVEVNPPAALVVA